MSSNSREQERRNRAMVELARARGWVADEDLDRAMEESSLGGGEIGARLFESGKLTVDQVASLREAVDGTPTRAMSSSSDRTVTAGGAHPPARPSSSPPTQIGPYRILTELGRGGMGVVYRALHPELRREVALKVLLHAGRADDLSMERFRREAALVAKIGRHPHLVQVHDVGRDGECAYFTMDFVDGRSLKQRIDADGALPPREAAAIAADLAGALGAAHRAGVVHRDVKPHNVLLDRSGEAWLSDFGLAKDMASAQGLTATGETFGTPSYMSPEQASGHSRHATPAADLYSLGATLYEMLTGHRPFAAPTPVETMRLVVTSDPVPPHSLRGGIHPDLEVICLHAMRKEPARRFASASEFEADLRRFLAGEPIHARPIGALERIAARARRRPGLVAAAACALLSALIAVGWAGRKFLRHHEAEAASARAERGRKDAEEAARPQVEKGRSLVDLAQQSFRAGDGVATARFSAEAIETLERAKKLQPDDADLRYELGRAFRLARKPDAAMLEFEAAVAIRPTHALAWYEHGLLACDRVLAAQGKQKRGVAIQRSYAIESSGTTLGGVMFARGNSGGDDPAARAAARRDFQQLPGLGVAGSQAAFGRGMLLFLAGNAAEAKSQFSAAIDADPYFAEAHRARAEMIEDLVDVTEESLEDRRKVHELQPGNELVAWEYAFALALAKKREPALAVVKSILAHDAGTASLDNAADVAEICGDDEASIIYRRRSVQAAKEQQEVDVAAQALFSQLARQERFALRTRFFEEVKDRLSPMMKICLDAQDAANRVDWKKASALFRSLPPDCPYLPDSAEAAANAEWLCGNLDLAARLADLVMERQLILDAEHFRAQVAIDRGNFAAGVADYEAIRKRAPDYNQNLVHLAGARLLAGDAAGSADALADAIRATPLADESRAAAMKFVDALREKAKTADTVEKRIGLVELTLTSLTFMQGFASNSRNVNRSIGTAQRGLWYLLQRMYLDVERYDNSVAAGDAFMKFYRAGAVLYRQAAARALQKKPKTAIKLLGQALEEGFDDGSRLDGDPAFAGMREMPEYRELRAKCRSGR